MDLAALPPPHRLALAYAPRRARAATFALFALDLRLAALVRTAREPLPAQLKLAWWRERLAASPQTWPKGEPLLALLTCWGGEAANLGGLVDGWEAVLIDAQHDELAEGRAQACTALARLLDCPAAAERASEAGRRWMVAEFAPVSAAGPLSLPKDLRALAVLIKLLETNGRPKLRQFLGAMRTGLFG